MRSCPRDATSLSLLSERHELGWRKSGVHPRHGSRGDGADGSRHHRMVPGGEPPRPSAAGPMLSWVRQAKGSALATDAGRDEHDRGHAQDRLLPDPGLVRGHTGGHGREALGGDGRGGPGGSRQTRSRGGHHGESSCRDLLHSPHRWPPKSSRSDRLSLYASSTPL